MAEYTVPIREQFEFQQPVIDKDLTAPPAEPAKGNRYIVAAAATGAWTGHETHIAEYDGAAWTFVTPTEGFLTWVKDEDLFYEFIAAWGVSEKQGDMLKSTYDTDADGIVDKAENVDDGAGNASTAADVKDAVTKKHTAGADTDLDATFEATFVKKADTVNVLSDITSPGANIEDAVTKKHTQGTDQGLDTGGASAVTAAQTKEAYTKRAVYDADLKCLKFTI